MQFAIASRTKICYNQAMIDIAKYAGLKICVAVSGGRDSMALLHYIHTHSKEHGITLSALNCDHKIRGEASARDSKFVKEWCKQNNIPLIAFEWNESVLPANESFARLWRLKCYVAATRNYDGVPVDKNSPYEIPSAICTEDGKWQGVDAVATAHHLDDNAETVIFNLARGSSLSGAEGITDGTFPVEGGGRLQLIRPFVCVSREEIDGYISENGIPFVEDSTNYTDSYTRNKIRHNVLPELEKAVPGAAKAIYRFSRLAADDEQYFDNLIKERRLIKQTRLGCEIMHCAEKVVFKRAAVKALNVYNVKDYTSLHAQKLYELQFAPKGKKFEFLGYTAFKEDGKIAVCDNYLLKICQEGIPFKEHFDGEFSLWNDTFIYISDGNNLEENLLAFGAAAQDDNRIPARFKTLKFDAETIPDGAVIRFMKAGDKFTRFGGGTKSLGDYFTDKKIPVRIRGKIPLIADECGILAVGGVEISDKIKITENTKKTMYLVCADYSSQD